MGKKEGITRNELARRIEEAVKHIPNLGKLDWKTIYLALSRERRRVRKLIADANAALPEDPDVRMWMGKLKGEEEHITKIMTVLGESGRNMLIRGVGRSIYVIEEKAEALVAEFERITKGEE